MQDEYRFPSISIIIPSWNQGQYIERTLLSILRQDYPGQVQVIVSDGGSKDSTIEVLKKYHNHIMWWSAPDEGYVDAVTKGLAAATGEVLAIQSSDDYYLPGAFRLIAKAFQQHPLASFITGGEHVINLEEIVEHSSNPMGPITPHTILFNVVPPQHATFVKREYVTKVGGMRREVDMCADMDLWYRVSHLVPGHYITDYVAVYQNHPEQRIRTSLKWYSSLVKMVETCEQDIRYGQLFKLSKIKKNQLYSFWKILWPSVRSNEEAELVAMKMLPLYALYDERTKALVYQHTLFRVQHFVVSGVKDILKKVIPERIVEQIKNNNELKNASLMREKFVRFKIDNAWLYCQSK